MSNGAKEMFDKKIQVSEMPRERGESAADVFRWKDVPSVDGLELEKWLGTTGVSERQFPLAVALQVHDELEEKFTSPGKADALLMAECRGGIKALKRFCQIYQCAITGHA